MAIPGLTYRLVKGSSLTHLEMDNNFRSLIYSSSIHDGGDTLHLHFDTTAGTDKHIIPLNGGSGGLTISGNENNRVVTATGTSGLLQGESAFTFDGDTLSVTGRLVLEDSDNNTLVGSLAGSSAGSAECNVLIGKSAATNIAGNNNVGIGGSSLVAGVAVENNVSLGHSALSTMTTGNNNVAVGSTAGGNNTNGCNNLYLGYGAGPGASTTENNKLYINNSANNNPLILGDFTTGQVTVNSQISASVFSGSFFGDGSGITGVTTSAEWDGTLDGNAQISGSLIVSGASVNVNFIDTTAISGSIFSGSFVGNGSGLTGVTVSGFPHSGSAEITGSLTVIGPTVITGSTSISGSLNVTGTKFTSGSSITLGGSVVVEDQGSEFAISSPATHTIAIGKGIFSCRISDAANTPGSNATTCIVEAVRNVLIGTCAFRNGKDVNNVVIGAFAATEGLKHGIAIGDNASFKHVGRGSISIGYQALGSFNPGSGRNNIAIGCKAMRGNATSGEGNVGIGECSLYVNQIGKNNTAVGGCSLRCIIGISSVDGLEHTALGYSAGAKTKFGRGNVYIGHKAGPSVNNTNESNQLYIANNEGYPLIGGDFSVPSVTISGSVHVSQSVEAQSFTGSFQGDGSGITGITVSAFPLNGDAVITGSLLVSGSGQNIDFTDAEAGVSGSFSGSYVGNGSGLTGVTSEWDGSRNGNSSITGSLIVSGALDVSNTVTIGSTGYPGGPGVEMIHFHSSSLAGVHNIQSFVISSTGYTGFKADYSLFDNDESEKKVGTLLGAWDQAGGETLNDSHTIATGNIVGTSFSIDSDGSTAILKLNAGSGTYHINMLITAFKRQV